MTKEENIASNSTKKPLEDKQCPFKKISEDVYEWDGYVKEDWYKPRGIDSLHYHYSEDDAQYILRICTEKWGVAVKKEVIGFNGW